MLKRPEVAGSIGGCSSTTNSSVGWQVGLAELTVEADAGVRPGRRAARLTRRECAALAEGLVRVLKRSIETGGSSISDYVAPDGSDGAYQDERRVYARTGEPCHACGTPIKRRVIAQRSSHYCPQCQQ